MRSRIAAPGPMVFQICSVNILLGCLLIGAMETADCISREKREGTPGLLFLTNLNSAEIVAGKLCSKALALRLKHPGFAPITSVFLALAPPTLLFSLVCYLFDRWNLTRMPDRQLVPIMMWIGFGICLGNCLLLSVWAAMRLRRDFRTTVTSRYEPPSRYRWRIPSRRALMRFGAAATASVLALVLIVVLFYSYQNSQSRRR